MQVHLLKAQMLMMKFSINGLEVQLPQVGAIYELYFLLNLWGDVG